jgi:hypothetical protein
MNSKTPKIPPKPSQNYLLSLKNGSKVPQVNIKIPKITPRFPNIASVISTMIHNNKPKVACQKSKMF